jgi:hypothetical protein
VGGKYQDRSVSDTTVDRSAGVEHNSDTETQGVQPGGNLGMAHREPASTHGRRGGGWGGRHGQYVITTQQAWNCAGGTAMLTHANQKMLECGAMVTNWCRSHR